MCTSGMKKMIIVQYPLMLDKGLKGGTMKPSKARSWLRRNECKFAKVKALNTLWRRTKLARQWKEATTAALR